METSCKVCGGAHTTGACTENNAATLDRAFADMGSGFTENKVDKVREYYERIRAAQEGRPLKAYDTVDNLLPDFRQMSGQEWSENFDMDQYRNEQLGTKPTEGVNAEKKEPINAERINRFILKLAEAPNIGDEEAINAIAKQIELLEADKNFPELLAALDPDSYSPKTKQLDGTAKRRLTGGLDKHLQERGPK